jgi:hypothetical protein
VLPVLIGTTPMPGPDDLPPSIRTVALQNAVTVGVLHDFDTHMRALLPRIEAILGALPGGAVMSSPLLVRGVSLRLLKFLQENAAQSADVRDCRWWLGSPRDAGVGEKFMASIYLHRAVRLAELLELHVLMSFWGHPAIVEQVCGGWVLGLFERTPVLELEGGFQMKMRLSDEDPRQVWKMLTDAPLRLSLAYVATASATNRG